MTSATVSANLAEITASLQYLRYLNTPFYLDPNFLGALLASSVALLIALFSEPLRRMWQTARLKFDVVLKNVQGSGVVYYRLVAENAGNTTVKDSEVYVVKIFDDGVERQNFLPVPLRWTHASAYMTAGVYRNIHPKQTVLLDFCEYIAERNLVRLFLAAGGEVGDYSIVRASQTRVFLKGYQGNGKVVEAEILINWQGGQEPVITIDRQS